MRFIETLVQILYCLVFSFQGFYLDLTGTLFLSMFIDSFFFAYYGSILTQLYMVVLQSKFFVLFCANFYCYLLTDAPFCGIYFYFTNTSCSSAAILSIFLALLLNLRGLHFTLRFPLLQSCKLFSQCCVAVSLIFLALVPPLLLLMIQLPVLLLLLLSLLLLLYFHRLF